MKIFGASVPVGQAVEAIATAGSLAEVLSMIRKLRSGRYRIVLANEESQDGEATQPRDVRNAGGGREA